MASLHTYSMDGYSSIRRRTCRRVYLVPRWTSCPFVRSTEASSWVSNNSDLESDSTLRTVRKEKSRVGFSLAVSSQLKYKEILWANNKHRDLINRVIKERWWLVCDSLPRRPARFSAFWKSLYCVWCKLVENLETLRRAFPKREALLFCPFISHIKYCEYRSDSCIKMDVVC